MQLSHAGWKGAYRNILTRVVKFMLKKDCHIKDIYVAIGPCISQNYNVKEDFFKKFIKKDKKNSKFFKKRKICFILTYRVTLNLS